MIFNLLKKVRLLVITLALSGASDLFAQTNTIIPIETKTNAVVLQVGADKRVGMIYFGSKLAVTDEYKNIPGMYRQGDDYSGILNSAYTPAGSRNLVEPAIEVVHADGNTSLDLQYVSHAVKKETANISVTSVAL